MFKRKEEYVLRESKFKRKKKTVAAAEITNHEEDMPQWEEVENTGEAAAETDAFESTMPPKMKKAPFYKSRVTVGRLLIGAAIIITLLVSPTLGYLRQQETITVIVATADISKGDNITNEMLSVATVSMGSVLPIQKMNITDVAGKYAKSDIVKGEIISSPKISSQLPFDNAYLYSLPEGKKAMSVEVAKLYASLSGKLEAGDVVSVYLAGGKESKDIKEASRQPPELSYVEVLSTTNVDGIDINTAPEKSALENPLPATVTLAVDEVQAIILAGSETRGGVHLALSARKGSVDALDLLKFQKDFNASRIAAYKENQVKEAVIPSDNNKEIPEGGEEITLGK